MSRALLPAVSYKCLGANDIQLP